MIVLAALLCTGSLAAMGEANAQAADCRAPSGETLEIASLDIHLEPRLADGRKLRLRGVEPPRGTQGNPQLAEQARKFLSAQIAGKSLAIAFAPVDRDRWGRYPANLATPPGPARHPMLAGEIIAQGWARADPLDMPRECRTDYLRLESEAREARRGLWADPAYAVLDAARPEAFAGQGGRIVLAEGKVASVGQWRTLVFLNFGRGRGGASVALARPVQRELEREGRRIADLKDARIRVRGLLQLRQSPRIEIFSAAAIEMLAPTPAPRNENGN